MSTRAQILAEIAAQFPDNTTGLITPAKRRQVVEDVTNSCLVSETDAGTAGKAVLTAETQAQGRTALGVHLNIVRRTLAGNLVLTAADLPRQKVIPDADRDVTLPAESTAQWMFEICHGGAAYVITLKRAGGTVVAVLVPGGVTVVAWDGVAFGMC